MRHKIQYKEKQSDIAQNKETKIQYKEKQSYIAQRNQN